MDIIEKKMNLINVDELPVQMFEVAKCNLHCWWCYLPKELRNITQKYMSWLSVSELMDLFENEKNNVKCIYLSGGNPELVPELIYQFMMELEKRKLDNEIFLWSDDVLTTDFLENKLSKEQIKYMVNYKNYAKICCLKGFDRKSFRYNTGLKLEEFDNQIKRLDKYIKLGFDVYGYIIFVCQDLDEANIKIKNLMDELQRISYYLPLRIIPIKIEKFTTILDRLNDEKETDIRNQYEILKIWNEEIRNRFLETEINSNIAEVQLKRG